MSDLVWNRDGKDWPNRDASSFVQAAGIRWHVQRMGRGRRCFWSTAPAQRRIHGAG